MVTPFVIAQIETRAQSNVSMSVVCFHKLNTRLSVHQQHPVTADRTPLTTHICAIQSVHKRGTHRTRLAQELHNIFVRLKRISHLVCTCLTLCCSRTSLAPRAHLLPHSLFLLPRHQNTQHSRDNTIYSKTNQYIINLSRVSQSTSSAIKNHSGVKACRVAETRERQLHSHHQASRSVFSRKSAPCMGAQL